LASGGGTGGHVYPILAVVEQFKKAAGDGNGLPKLEALLYVGTRNGLEVNIVARQGVAFRSVRAAAVRGLFPLRALVNASEMLRGSVQAWRILRDFRPDVVLATGGYVSVPVVIAARLQRCPILVYLPDMVPGLAVRFLSRLAQRVAVSFDTSLDHFAPGKAVVTGYPVRASLYAADRTGARQRLGLDARLKTVLVFGGSRGAHSINVAVSGMLDSLLDFAQVIHIAGEGDVVELQRRRSRLAADRRERYLVHAYLHEEMIDALLAADLAVARAGAATLGEFAAVGLASIQVPYPYSGQHQEANADFMVRHGAALKVPDTELAEGGLWRALEELLSDESALHSMSNAVAALARPDAARAIAKQLVLVAGGV
jgi:UDP-N-acetylglucosamine--N-acetylmuramyl-(pentapeptide) pyrophosphoryl-undecaprenol N-acetylglucosamine transferase